MRAVRFHEHGSADVLRVEEVETPVPAQGEILVRVRACGVNHIDLLVREGRAEVAVPLPQIPGSEIAGEVVAHGAGVDGSAPAPGRRVAIHTRATCEACGPCLRGAGNLCLRPTAMGLTRPGGFAEFVTAPAHIVLPLPDGVTFRDSAAASLSTLAAWHMLVTRARVKEGETVLVLGAGSGVGGAAVQIALLHGARVLATAGSAEKRSRALEAGAAAALDHTGPFAAEVRRLTGRRGVDVVVEHVGAATFDESIASLARGGRLVTCGAHTGRRADLDLWRLFSKEITLMGAYLGTREELRSVLDHLAAGRLRPILHAVLPLEGVADAQRMLEARRVFGKIVIEPR